MNNATWATQNIKTLSPSTADSKFQWQKVQGLEIISACLDNSHLLICILKSFLCLWSIGWLLHPICKSAVSVFFPPSALRWCMTLLLVFSIWVRGKPISLCFNYRHVVWLVVSKGQLEGWGNCAAWLWRSHQRMARTQMWLIWQTTWLL